MGCFLGSDDSLVPDLDFDLEKLYLVTFDPF
jgi:hypothetical protein